MGGYNNPIPTRFLAPIHCLKIPALKHFSAAGKNKPVPRPLHNRSEGQPLAHLRENARKVRARRVRLLPHHLHTPSPAGSAGQVHC